MTKVNLVTGIGIGVVVAAGLTAATSIASPSIEEFGHWAAEQTPGKAGVIAPPNRMTAPAARQSQGFSAVCPASNVWTLELQEINGQRTARVLDQPECAANPTNSDEARLRGYVVGWMLQHCADNRPGEEANFRHYQLAGFKSYDVRQTGEATWSFRSGSETWYITERPSVMVSNPHGNDWCLK